MPLSDHLRTDEHGSLGGREALERLPQLVRLRDRIGVEPDPCQLRDVALEFALEPLRPRADPRELRRAAVRARLARGLAGGAVVAAERSVPMERERNVAVGAAAGRAPRGGGGGGGRAGAGGGAGAPSPPP